MHHHAGMRQHAPSSVIWRGVVRARFPAMQHACMQRQHASQNPGFCGTGTGIRFKKVVLERFLRLDLQPVLFFKRFYFEDFNF
jgi:hypothetical protein